MLTKLAFKNVFKSFKDYAIYFFTLVLGVSIFYLFNAIEAQTALIEVTKSGRDVIKLMINTISGLSVFIAVILASLIIYASRFLMKRRHKEFAIYLTLGMSKRKVSTLLLIETLLVGAISLIVGLIVGVCLSQFMSVIVVNMFESDMTKYEFVFSAKTCVKTLVYFGIMYLVVMLFNTFTVGKYKLIDLLQSGRKSEKIKIKNPILCIFIFIIACIMLGFAYYKVTSNPNDISSVNKLVVPIILGAVSTFLIFWSLSGLILKIVMSMKKTYYKGLNSFTLRQISSKINTTVVSMSIICLMLFVTICVLSSALSLRNDMVGNLKEYAPVDIVMNKTKDIPKDTAGYSKELIDDSYLTIEQSLNKIDFNVDENFKDIVKVNTFTNENLLLKNSLAEDLQAIEKEFEFLGFLFPEQVMKISDYNKVAKAYGKETYELNKNQYIVIADYENMVQIRNRTLKNGQQLSINGKNFTPKYNECKDGFLEIAPNALNQGIILFDDEIIEQNFEIEKEYLIANYKADSKEEKIKIENKILDLSNNRISDSVRINAMSKIAIAEAGTGLGALVTFIGLYLGIVFLITSAGLLALKQLTESADSKQRYEILRKLGADKKMINKSLFIQIFVFFMFPLFIAIIHSIFGLKFSNYILSMFGGKSLTLSIVMTAIFLVLIYGGYFLVTYFSSKGIINKDK